MEWSWLNESNQTPPLPAVQPAEHCVVLDVQYCAHYRELVRSNYCQLMAPAALLQLFVTVGLPYAQLTNRGRAVMQC